MQAQEQVALAHHLAVAADPLLDLEDDLVLALALELEHSGGSAPEREHDGPLNADVGGEQHLKVGPRGAERLDRLGHLGMIGGDDRDGDLLAVDGADRGLRVEVVGEQRVLLAEQLAQLLRGRARAHPQDAFHGVHVLPRDSGSSKPTARASLGELRRVPRDQRPTTPVVR